MLWSLTAALGGHATVVGPMSTGLWAPVAGTPFAQDCHVWDSRRTHTLPRPDVVVAVKAWPASLGRALRVAEERDLAIVADVDDADYEAMLGKDEPVARRATNFARITRAGVSFPRWRALQAVARRLPLTVSNPVLQGMYGGEVVPHVRDAAVPQPAGRSGGPLAVVFIGTNRGHKGISVLRSAVAMLPPGSVTLTVTDSAPDDVQDHESWIGTTSLEAGRALIAASDVVAVPSLLSGYSHAQFPVKVVDGMVERRAVVASDLPVIRWAVGDGARLVPPGDSGALAAALDELRDLDARTKLAQKGHAHAMTHFATDVVAPVFEGVLVDAVRRHRGRT